MIVSDEGQARVFVIYILFGMLCIALADCFWVLRGHFGTTRARVNILDGLYYIIAFVIILYAGVKYNFGALRYYQLFALGIGMMVQKLVLSHITRRIFDFVLVYTLRAAAWVLRLVWRIVMIFLKGAFAFTDFCEQKMLRYGHKVKKYHDKVKIKRQKNKKTVKKRLRMI